MGLLPGTAEARARERDPDFLKDKLSKEHKTGDQQVCMHVALEDRQKGPMW